MGEGIELQEKGWVGEAWEVFQLFRAGKGCKVWLLKGEVVEEGVEPGACGGGLGGVVDERERESVFALKEDGGGDAVSPEVSRWGVW